MVKQIFSKMKKVLPILLTFFFLATLTVASASAGSSDPRFDEHGHFWSIDGHHMRYDGQFWWDDIHHIKWDGHHWWKGHKWFDGHIWH